MFTVIANLGYSGVDDGFSVLEQVQDLGVVLFVFCFERRSYGSRDYVKGVDGFLADRQGARRSNSIVCGCCGCTLHFSVPLSTDWLLAVDCVYMVLQAF